ncbi:MULTISPECIES: ApeI family dehydratase [Vibrio]|uniref:3-hydroxyacyl-ACP dehydratase n=1 Tax=Vibrio algicola TaxID=2662262 RepID=A0A5Q0THM4_9VIBR|nr:MULTISPECIES: 3-hydroxyacyl-ACP dehydratase [Vibrio]MBD1575183.1 3-hydroxyacyl-ACP dehydratase [Vibrio sp. S11_S32]
MKRKPSILSQQISQTHPAQITAILDLHVEAEIEDFKGHFPVYSLLPGVTQVDWAIYFAQQLLATPSDFKGMEVIKFQQPILKDSQVTLTLDWHSDKQKLYFSYTSPDTVHSDTSTSESSLVTHSSGRILLG